MEENNEKNDAEEMEHDADQERDEEPEVPQSPVMEARVDPSELPVPDSPVPDANGTRKREMSDDEMEPNKRARAQGGCPSPRRA